MKCYQWLVNIPCMFAMLFGPGCASVVTRMEEYNYAQQPNPPSNSLPPFYKGVVCDVGWAAVSLYALLAPRDENDPYWPPPRSLGVIFPFALIDLPLSVAMDTLLIPYDIFVLVKHNEISSSTAPPHQNISAPKSQRSVESALHSHDYATPQVLEQAHHMSDDYFDGISRDNIDTNAMDQLGRQIIEMGATQSHFLNEFAWRLLTEEDLQYRNMDTAVNAARVAYEVSEGSRPYINDTYALAVYAMGDIEAAVKLQREALDRSETWKEWQGFLSQYEVYRLLAGSPLTTNEVAEMRDDVLKRCVPDETVSWTPSTAKADGKLVIMYRAHRGVLRHTDQVYIHLGFDGWREGSVVHAPMKQDADSVWSFELTVPRIARQVDFVFTENPSDELTGMWDNNGGRDWSIYVDRPETITGADFPVDLH